ncbi:hypothetical protein L249_4759 [Ophiocordyceps polyrhachis-furcata BCC 54312]|uniref:Ribosome quality control complex subunit 2 n=1 Tax=Ophiocordyceps polyrhachis-furcata BCC 54312 TaxID=1330021 RepID=A0A367L2Y7_9HYPO|nr:hypothetical protein L249_4759 [Ophiocordyceps polyrhachis-furcata BCC 54312]
MKQRFSSLDVKVIAHELNQALVTLRVANIYDLSSKILLFKFAKPDSKKQLIIDSGFRCHLTEFARTTAAAPSAFVAQLRKFLKTRRVTSVVQIGTDRVLELQFSDGQYRLFLEFFASGNIILADTGLTILTIARNVSEAPGQEPQRVGLKYSLDNRQNYPAIPALSKQRVRLALESSVERAAACEAAEKPKGKSMANLRKSLAVSVTEIPPVMVDHTLRSNGFDLSAKPEDILQSDVLLDKLVQLLGEAREKVQEITSSSVCTGYIFAKRKDKQASADDASPKREDLLYYDFHPFVPTVLGSDPAVKVLEFSGYNQTVDEFFSSIEGQKLESRLTQRQETARRKLEAAKQDQAKRLEGLQEAQSVNFRRAAAIEANVERVQEAMDAVNGLLAQGMDWIDVGKLVERERKKKNPVAEIIVLPLNLAENMMTLRLAEAEADDDEEPDPFETDDSDSDGEAVAPSSQKAKQVEKSLSVEINLGISPWSNAREYYEQRRSAAAKEEKTQLQAAKALKNAEQKITQDLKKGLKQEKALLQPIRQQMWFEKFTWFVSSDGYLVLGGKDAAQNEMLYRKFLRKGDIYCHADLRGAPMVIVKNNPKTPEAPIPPATLSQAGSLAVCSSDAWDSKAGMGAWWVKADQVSKSAPAGEFLPEGSFMVRGKKNHLAPAQLLLGFGIMFKVSEASKGRHVKHRQHDEPAVVEANQTEEAEEPQPASDDELVDGSEDEAAAETQQEEDAGDAVPDHQSEDENDGSSRRDNPLQALGQAEVDDETSELGVSQLAIVSDSEQNQSTNEAAQDDEPGDDGQDQPTPDPSCTTTSRSQPSAKAPPKRGQKGKAKKMANKYRDQDEEDRAAAEALIGAAAGRQKAEAEAKARAEAKAQLEAAKERRRAQHQRQQRETAAHEQARRTTMMTDEGAEATDLDALVGTPLGGDELLEAIAVCAPWNALGKFKYKAKMQPGATKKGKAVREVLDRWRADSAKKGAVDEASRDEEKMWPREVELIKALRPEEVINVVPVGKVRVMMAGGGGGGGGGKGKGKAGARGQAKPKGGRGGKGSKR